MIIRIDLEINIIILILDPCYSRETLVAFENRSSSSFHFLPAHHLWLDLAFSQHINQGNLGKGGVHL